MDARVGRGDGQGLVAGIDRRRGTGRPSRWATAPATACLRASSSWPASNAASNARASASGSGGGASLTGAGRFLDGLARASSGPSGPDASVGAPRSASSTPRARSRASATDGSPAVSRRRSTSDLHEPASTAGFGQLERAASDIARIGRPARTRPGRRPGDRALSRPRRGALRSPAGRRGRGGRPRRRARDPWRCRYAARASSTRPSLARTPPSPTYGRARSGAIRAASR